MSSQDVNIGSRGVRGGRAVRGRPRGFGRGGIGRGMFVVPPVENALLQERIDEEDEMSQFHFNDEDSIEGGDDSSDNEGTYITVKYLL